MKNVYVSFWAIGHVLIFSFYLETLIFVDLIIKASSILGSFLNQQNSLGSVFAFVFHASMTLSLNVCLLEDLYRKVESLIIAFRVIYTLARKVYVETEFDIHCFI